MTNRGVVFCNELLIKNGLVKTCTVANTKLFRS